MTESRAPSDCSSPSKSAAPTPGPAAVRRALAIETSARVGSLALLEAGEILAEDSFPHGLQHAAQMIPRVDALLKQVGWTPGDLTEIDVSIGPGSFTGLRIGVTFAKTFAFITGARLIAVPSLQVIAHQAPPEVAELIVVLDAKRGQIFAARYQRQRSQWLEAEPAHLDSLPEMLCRAARPVWLSGDGIPLHRHLIQHPPDVLETPEGAWRPTAAMVGALATTLFERGTFTEPQALIPIYVRRPEAEEKRDLLKR